MHPKFQAQLRLHIVGYFNIYFIFLGFTRVRIDFIGQRIAESRLVAFYVVCGNIAALVYVPISYVYETMDATLDNNLEIFTYMMNLLINFAAIAVSVLLRGQREGIHLEIAKSIISLDRSYFSQVCADMSTANRFVDHLLYFKMCALVLQFVAPFYDCFFAAYKVDAIEVMQTFYNTCLQSILVASHLMYFYLMWLLHKRFCLLNRKMKNVLRQLQQLQQVTRSEGQCRVSSSAQRRSVAVATEALLEISKIHRRLSWLLVRLNVGYGVQILAVLLSNLSDTISFGYFLTLVLESPADWKYDFDTVKSCLYVVIILIDCNLIYWISDITMAAHNKMAQILRRFQILPSLSDSFEQECEQFVLQLTQQKMALRIAGMFQLNRQSALGFWIFALTHIIIFRQFDLKSQLNKSQENPLLERFNQFFRIEEM